MELLQLTIEHFKGIDRLELALDGHDADIYGDNATGKTTIFDAIQWLLFGKDSAGRSGFEVKPLGEDGKAQLNGQEVVVEAVIRHEGQEKTLRRVYAENWTRQRGSAQAVFTGHTTAYWVDGLPLGQRQYQELMDAMIPEKLFRQLTNPYYFSHILKWQERREILFGMCGETGDGEVLESNPMFAPLAAALGSHTVERYRKVLQAGIKRVNGELKALPTRIDEASRGMAEVEPREALQAKLDAVNARSADRIAGYRYPGSGEGQGRSGPIQAENGSDDEGGAGKERLGGGPQGTGRRGASPDGGAGKRPGRIREPCRPDRREEIRTGGAAARMERGKQRQAPI